MRTINLAMNNLALNDMPTRTIHQATISNHSDELQRAPAGHTDTLYNLHW